MERLNGPEHLYSKTLTVQINEDMVKFVTDSGYRLPDGVDLSVYHGHVAEFITHNWGDEVRIYGLGVICNSYGPLEFLWRY